MPASTNPRRPSPLQNSSSTNEDAFESLFDRLSLEEDAPPKEEMPRLVAPPKSFVDDTEKENATTTPRPVRKSRMSLQSVQAQTFSDDSDEEHSEGEDEDFLPLKNDRLRARTPSIAKGYLTPRRPSVSQNEGTQTSPKKKSSISVRSTPRNSNASEIIRGTATTPGLHKSGRRLPSLFDDDMEGTPSSRPRNSLFDMSMTPSRRKKQSKDYDDEDEMDKLNFLRGFKGIAGGSTRQISLKQSLAELRKGEESKKNGEKLPVVAAFEDVPSAPEAAEQTMECDDTTYGTEMDITPKAKRYEVDQQLLQEIEASAQQIRSESVHVEVPSVKEPKIKAEVKDERSSLSPTPESSGSRGYSREVSVGVVIPVKGKATTEKVLIKKEEEEEEEDELSQSDGDETFASVQESSPTISAASSERADSVFEVSDEEDEDEEEEDEPVRARKRPTARKVEKSPSKSSTPPTASEPSISRSVTPMVVIPVAPRPKKLNAVKKQATPAMTPSRDRSATGLKSFKKVRVQLAEDILKQLLSTLKSEMDKYGPMRECFINWSSTLRQTAGMAKFKKMRPVEIQLSEKVVDDEERLWNTLCHEFCHVLAYHYYEELGHGSNFKKWAKVISKYFPHVTITTCHNYKIEYKYRWDCTQEGCGASYGRHSASIDIKRQVCGRCKSKLVQVLPKPTGEKKLTAYQIFVKENLPKAKVEIKNAGLPNGKAMSLVAEWWKEEKAKSGNGFSKEASPAPSVSSDRELSVVPDYRQGSVTIELSDDEDVVILSD